MKNNYKKKRTLSSYLALIGIFLFFNSYAQNQPEVKLVDILKNLTNTYGVDFIYNHTLLDQVTFSSAITCEKLTECLNIIQQEAHIEFLADTDSSYMIVPIRTDISFSISDNETTEPITDIRVQVNNDEQRLLIAKQSIFTLDDIFPLDSIFISAAFYKTISIKAKDLESLNASLKMEHSMIHLNEVFITDYLTKGINAKISNNTIQIDMNSLGLLAGDTDGDIYNVIKNIPGVHTPSGKPGSLNFRGSTFDQSLIQIDDIPIYHNGHFYGVLAPYNPSMVDKIDIQRNTLSAKWGGRVGGLIDMTTGGKVPDSTTYEVQVNSVYGGATIKAPIVKNRLALYLAARSNYPTINSPKMQAYSILNFQGSRLETVAEEVNSENFKVGFYDINSKLIYDINENHKATLSFINIQNDLSATLKDAGDEDNKDFRNLNLDNWGLTLKWDGKLSDKLRALARFSRSTLYIDNISEGFTASERSSFEKYANTIEDTRFITEFKYDFNSNTIIETGYTLTDYGLSFDERNEENSINNRRDQTAITHSAFLNVNKNWNDKLTAEFGLHTDYYEPTGVFYADPRISLNLQANEALYFKTSMGRSHQFIQKKLREDFDDFNNKSQFWYLPDETTTVLDGYQGMIGALYNKSGWLIDFEFYLRNSNNITLQTNTETLQTGKLKSIGTDLFVKKRWNNLETMIGYSLSKVNTKFDDTNPVFFDQRHILNITGLWHLNAFEVAVTWSYLSGMPVVIPDFDIAEGTEEDFEIPYKDRFPGQHQLDVSTTYTFNNKRKTWKGIVGVSFVNLYDQDNIVNLFQNEPSVINPYRKGIDFAPNLQLSFQF
ncbi:TonB-dependent receptor plug domain-containing protein [Maribacter sp. Asnod1-A12]|uniref:TonB-dependent receptor plug domain-containing protein n=1 Tax=Maribacter sp. Asnod1-A12 TaxID=3160576 RepID=UPI0038638E37